uniref:Uncharacterized protein n=1 Tax=Ananas comosus var. bracteatus TaxID=296719 RepID=A0A6V7NZ93_ANACO|nr:unnamed protein product [Ananas comosus var. bracteatus]
MQSSQGLLGEGLTLRRACQTALALESAAEGDLPDLVPLRMRPCLDVGELVPDGAGGGVAEAVEGHAGGLDVDGLELDFLATRVAKKRSCSLTGRRGAEGGDVGLEGAAGDGHEVLGEGDAHLALLVLLLVHAPEGRVRRRRGGCAPRARTRNLARAALGGAVGEQHGGPPHAEEAVGDEHGLAVAEVPVERDVLRADDDGVGGAVHLQQVAREVDGDDPRAATHPAQVVAPDVPRSRYRFTIMAESDGVGLKRLQFTTSTPTSLGLIPVARNRLSSAPNITCSASARAFAIDGRGGTQCIAAGTYVSSPSPLRSRILPWNSSAASLKPQSAECSMNARYGACSSLGERSRRSPPGTRPRPRHHVQRRPEHQQRDQRQHAHQVVLQVHPQLPQLVRVVRPASITITTISGISVSVSRCVIR